MAWNPWSISRNSCGPIATISDRPIAESIEYRPPTQSQKPNMLFGSIPNSLTFSSFVDTATKCLATAASSRNPSRSHARAVEAFVSVSSVVNVFDETMNSVSAGSRPRVASQMSVPSTFDTNRKSISHRLKFFRASYAIAGPRSDPPMPMLITVRIRCPVNPLHEPSRTASENDAIFVSTACTSGTTFTRATSRS